MIATNTCDTDDLINGNLNNTQGLSTSYFAGAQQVAQLWQNGLLSVKREFSSNPITESGIGKILIAYFFFESHRIASLIYVLFLSLYRTIKLYTIRTGK